MKTGPGDLGQWRLIIIILIMIIEDALLRHVLRMSHQTSLIVIIICGVICSGFWIRNDPSPRRLRLGSAGNQGMCLIVNVIEQETRLAPGDHLQPEPPELCPELGCEHGGVVRERGHGDWCPQP